MSTENGTNGTKIAQNREAEFLGRITASVTHELRNVLAIIQESSGLAEDLLAAGDDAGGKRSDRLVTTLSTINNQITRGVDLLGHLNRLAHGPDESVASVFLNQQVAQATALAERFARQKNVALHAEPRSSELASNTSPLALQMALAAAIECFLQHLSSGETITLSAEVFDGAPTIAISCRDGSGNPPSGLDDIAQSPCWATLVELTDNLGGRIQIDKPAARVRLIFSS
jgi:C4-dicarboxylate-specific signal transduction histidine kinase